MSDSDDITSNPIDSLSRIVNLVSSESGGSELLEKLKSISAKYELLSDEDKSQFQRHVKEKLTDRLVKKGIGSMPGVGMMDRFAMPEILLLAGFLLFVVIFVFFGYKLFKSLRDRETKREEKRRQKQLRKKK